MKANNKSINADQLLLVSQYVIIFQKNKDFFMCVITQAYMLLPFVTWVHHDYLECNNLPNTEH